MKFPHPNLLILVALLILPSCGKESIIQSDTELSLDSSISTRCCDDDVTAMVEDPRFVDFYEMFIHDLFDPATSLFDQIDSEKLSKELLELNDCIDSGNSVDYCLSQSEILMSMQDIINGLDLEALNALREQFDYLDDATFSTTLVGAVDQVSQDSGHRLTCYMKLRTDLIKMLATASATALGSVPAGVVVTIFALVKTRIDYCNCLYETYGAQC